MWLSCEDFTGTVYDEEERRCIPLWVRVDPEAGLVEAAHPDDAGRPRLNSNGQPVLYLAKGKLRVNLRPRPPIKFDTSTVGAAKCTRCPSNMTLAGDDLCVVCRAREQGRQIKVEPVSNLLLPMPCDNRCGRRATWQVSDETVVSPQQAIGTYMYTGYIDRERRVKRTYKFVNPTFRRASITARRWYCSWCYQPPRVLDEKGEVVSSVEVATRPS